MRPGPETEVVIIDSGGANIASLQFALARLGAGSIVSADSNTILNARRVILPGVGSAPDAMARLRERGLTELIPSLRQPVLGICLGMQLLYAHSEEGPTPCLGIVPARVSRFTSIRGRPVPHMGWNQIQSVKADPLLEDVKDGDYVYFVHSFAAAADAAAVATTDYGGFFASVSRWHNFWGTQFHPERSGKTGGLVLRNFLHLPTCA